jgi:hypothetical protein
MAEKLIAWQGVDVQGNQVSGTVPVTLEESGPSDADHVFTGEVSMPNGFVVPEGEVWEFDPDVSTTVRCEANVEVWGKLRMKPANANVKHRLIFENFDEDDFDFGDPGDHTVAPNDVGVWVMHNGTVDWQGAPKTAWTRLTGAASAGSTSIQVQDATGWRVGDELVVTATSPNNVWAYSRRTITSINGNTIGLNGGLQNSHPQITLKPGLVRTAEVLNLTRNILIQGQPSNRSHVIFHHNHTPEAPTIRYVELAYMGPPGREDAFEGTSRYALHFHHMMDNSQGTLVEGVVARDGANHAFVPHTSHGITFRDCISHENRGTAYWWDSDGTPGRRDQVPTHQLTWERCVASAVRGRWIEGFFIGFGQDNVCRGCVAVSVGDNAIAVSGGAGYTWPEHNGPVNNICDPRIHWVFEDNEAHNCDGAGIYYWHNNVGPTQVVGFKSYHCTTSAIDGAYENTVSWRNNVATAHWGQARNGEQCGQFAAKALDGGECGAEKEITDSWFDAAGRTQDCFILSEHSLPSGDPVVIRNCHFQGGTRSQIRITGIQSGKFPHNFRFENCTFGGPGQPYSIAPGASGQVYINGTRVL